MTSKEFQRKCAFYRSLHQAAELFTNPAFDGTVYRVSCEDFVGRKLECYTAQPSLLLYGDTALTGFKYLYFDHFSISEFRVQMRYFQSFVSVLSQYQLDILNADPSLNYLINIL